MWSNSYTPPHFGRGRLQTEAVVRRRASKAVLGSPPLRAQHQLAPRAARPQPGGRPPAPETLAPAHPGDPCPESAEGTGPLAVWLNSYTPPHFGRMVWYGAPPTSRQCVLPRRVVASCSVHPVSEQHRQAVQSELVRSWVRRCDAGDGKRMERKLPASDEVIGHIVAMHLPRVASNEVAGRPV
jgi:hypothetical protein